MAYASMSMAQSTLFFDDLENGSSKWVLNEGTGDNRWILNDIYTGYPGYIADTPPQPAGVTNRPHSNYLHIYSYYMDSSNTYITCI